MMSLLRDSLPVIIWVILHLVTYLELSLCKCKQSDVGNDRAIMCHPEHRQQLLRIGFITSNMHVMDMNATRNVTSANACDKSDVGRGYFRF